jgi:hypothetical protein
MQDGWKSRKLWLAAFAMALLAGVLVVAAKWPAILPGYVTLAGSVVTLYSAFVAGNQLHKHLENKAAANASEEVSEEEPK